MITFSFGLSEKFKKYFKIIELHNEYESIAKLRNDYLYNYLFDLAIRIITLSNRTDLKVEILNDLEKIRQKNKSKTTKNNIELLKNKIEKIKIKHMESLHHNRLLQEIKIRLSSPNGLTQEDFPLYKQWNNKQEKKQKTALLKGLFKEFSPLKDGINFILTNLKKTQLRESTKASKSTVQIKLDPNIKYEAAEIALQSSSNFFPSISANKYTLNINLISADKAIFIKPKTHKLLVTIFYL